MAGALRSKRSPAIVMHTFIIVQCKFRMSAHFKQHGRFVHHNSLCSLVFVVACSLTKLTSASSVLAPLYVETVPSLPTQNRVGKPLTCNLTASVHRSCVGTISRRP